MRIIFRFALIASLAVALFGQTLTKPTSPTWQSSNPLATGATGYYMVTSSTSTITNFVPTGANLTCTGSPTLTTAPRGVGQSMVMTGAQSCSGSDSLLRTGNGPYTIAALVNSGSSGGGWLTTYGTSATSKESALAQLTAGCATNSVYYTNNGAPVACGTTAMNDGNPHTIVVIYDGSVWTVWIDAVGQSTTTPGGMNITSSGSVYIGSLVGSGSWTGTVDNVYYSNTAWTTTQISAYNTDPWQMVRPPTFTLAPSSLPQGTTWNITLTGNNTNWTSSSSFTASAGTIVAANNISPTQETLVLTTPATGSSITITDVSNSLTQTISLTTPLTGVQVLGSTATQYTLSLIAPSTSACTYESSTSQTFLPLDFDVDSVQFSGANSDSRAGAVSNAYSRQFVVGTRTAAVNLSGIRVSRALQAATQHYWRVTCGSASAVGMASTKTVPFGMTWDDGWLGSGTNDGNIGQQTLSMTRWAQYIDPQTGVAARRLTLPSDHLDVGVQTRCPTGCGSTLIGASAAWTNPTGIQGNTTPATIQSSTLPLFITDASVPPSGNNEPYFTGSNNGSQRVGHYVYAQLKIDAGVNLGGSQPSGPNSQLNICLAMNSTTACDNSSATLTATLTTAYQTFTFGSQTIGDLWRQTFGVGVPWPSAQFNNHLNFIIWKNTNSADTVSVRNANLTYLAGFDATGAPDASYQFISAGKVTGPEGASGRLAYINNNIYYVPDPGTSGVAHQVGVIDSLPVPGGFCQGNIGNIFQPNPGTVFCLSNTGQVVQNTLTYTGASYSEPVATQVCNGTTITTNCWTQTVINNASGADLWSLIVNFTASGPYGFDATAFPGGFCIQQYTEPETGKLVVTCGFGSVASAGHINWLIVFDPYATSNQAGGLSSGSAGNHGCIGTGSTVNPLTGISTGCVVSAIPVWRTPGSIGCTYKGNFDYAQGITTGSIYFTGGPGSGPWGATLINSDGSHTSFPASAGTDSCPTNPYGVSGNNCFQITVAQPSAGSNYIYTGAAGEYGNWVTGSYVSTNSGGCPNCAGTEMMQIVGQAASVTPGAVILWLWRNVNGEGFLSSGTTIDLMCSSNQNINANPVSAPWMFNFAGGTSSSAFGPTSLPDAAMPNWKTPTGNHAASFAGNYIQYGPPVNDSRCTNCYTGWSTTQAGSAAAKLGTVPTPTFAPLYPVFAGASWNGIYQSHAGISSTSPQFYDIQPFQGTGLATTWANPAGTLYKLTSSGLSTYAKTAPVEMFSGPYVLQNVSGPSSLIGGTTADNWKFCVTSIANECYAGSSVGDVYANVPGLTFNFSFTPGGSAGDCTTSYHGGLCAADELDLSLVVTPPFADNVMNGRLDFVDSGGGAARFLGHYGRPRALSTFANIYVGPGELAWGLLDCNLCDAGKPFMMLQIPPAIVDSVNRTTWIPQAISIPQQPGSDGAYINHWYAEYGSATPGYCSQRLEPCVTGSSTSGTNPFYYQTSEAGSWSPKSCTSGCTITLNLIPQRAVYYQIVRTLSGSVVSTGPVQLLMTP